MNLFELLLPVAPAGSTYLLLRLLPQASVGEQLVVGLIVFAVACLCTIRAWSFGGRVDRCRQLKGLEPVRSPVLWLPTLGVALCWVGLPFLARGIATSNGSIWPGSIAAVGFWLLAVIIIEIAARWIANRYAIAKSSRPRDLS